MANKKTLTPTSLPASLTLPQERKAEKALLFGLLASRKSLPEIAFRIRPEMFTHPDILGDRGLPQPSREGGRNGYTLGGERDTEALVREGRAVARPLRAGPARRLHGDRRRVRTAALPVHKGGLRGKAAHPEVPRAGT